MMTSAIHVNKDQVALVLTRIAAVVAFLVAISFPLGYALVALQDVGDSLDFKAKVKASSLNGLIANSPDVWMFAENRIQGLVSREPVPLDNELIQVFDAQGKLLLESGSPPAAPVMARSYQLFDSGEVVGRVAVIGSLRLAIYKSIIAALCGFVLGLFVFSVLRVLPLRAVRRATSALADERERVEAMLQTMTDGVITTDAQSRIMHVNPSMLAMLEAHSAAQVIGHDFKQLIAPEYQTAYAAHHQRVLRGESLQIQFEILSLGGGRRWLETQSVSLQDQGATVHLAVSRDITDRKKTDAELQRHRDELENLVQERTADLRVAAAAFDAQEAIVITDAKRLILRVNRSFTDITGFAASEIVGLDYGLLRSEHHSTEFYDGLWETVRRTGTWQGEVRDQRKSGEVYPKWLTISSLRDDTGAVSHFICAHHDITEQKAAQEEIRSLAFHDHLTGLPNRRLLGDRIGQAMASSERSKKCAALLFIDLDKFKTLNDTLGHDIGDLLLQQVAKRLESCVREGDTVARLGGDEFVVLLVDLSPNQLSAATQTENVGENILHTLNQPYQLANHKYQSTPSIGVTVFSDHRGTIDELLKRADLAMYQAKAAGRNVMRFFDPEMQAVVSQHAALETGLRHAIDQSQLVLHYQAQVDAHAVIIGVEALVRWQHPQRGLVSPLEFIPLAEETGLVIPMGRWVLETACRQLRMWSGRPELAHLTIAVNVSARQFHQKDFVDEVLAIVASTGADSTLLKLELTESLMVKDVEDVIYKMMRLKANGIGFSLDDFGTGYSSLSHLKRLPLDQLKIDQCFVKNILTDSNDAAIARMVLALASSLGLSVIAEGVETQTQKDLLVTMGCDGYQGYFFSRPLPIDAFEIFATGRFTRSSRASLGLGTVPWR
jgi:diguanylate cyclase (GGDEF)-like protein/PAS domain S-box-containing protein